jgi:hypothetical protein
MGTQKPTKRLTFADAVAIWRRFWRGEYQHRIAADYDVNQGRINEIIKEQRHKGSRAVAMSTRDDDAA